MVGIKEINVDEMLCDEEMVLMLETMLVDGNTIDSVKHYLRENVTSYALTKDESTIGYFTKQQSEYGGFMECHAYIYPSKRRYSIRALKAIVEYIKGSGFGVHTSVIGNFPHVVRTLKSIGFFVLRVEENAFTKKGIPYPLFHLTK